MLVLAYIVQVSCWTNLIFTLKIKRPSACISSNFAHFDSGIGEIEVFELNARIVTGN